MSCSCCVPWDVGHISVELFKDTARAFAGGKAVLPSKRQNRSGGACSPCPEDCYWTPHKSLSLFKSPLLSPKTSFYKWNKSQSNTSFSPRFFLFAVLYILEKESKDFASCVFPSGLFMVHDASWGGQHNVSVERQRPNVTTEHEQRGQAWLNICHASHK